MIAPIGPQLGDMQSGAADPFAPRRIGRFLYPMRIIAMGACIVMAALYVSHFGSYHWYYLFPLMLALTYPHVSHVIYARLRSRNVELATLFVDAFVLGSTVYITGFSLFPVLTLTTLALANGIALNGLPHMVLCALFLAAGMMVPMPLYGLNFRPRDFVEINLTCAVFLFVYFNIFAYTAYRRTILLQASRRELKQQKGTIEIEKKRSDNLLLSFLPAAVAREFDAGGMVKPRCYDSVSVLAIELENFGNAMRTLPPEELLGELNHCFKAFDAITRRHRLESLRTLGDSYLAVGGLPVANDTHPIDAVGAAVEIQDFMTQRKTARRAHGGLFFEVKIAIHTGRVVAGVVEARKFSYDVWGDAVDNALRVRRHVGAGAVGLSGDTYQHVRDQFAATPSGTVDGKDGGEIAVYTIDRNSPASGRGLVPSHVG
jgi:class 3 adenylate cyclase